jgi:hypothetical protein
MGHPGTCGAANCSLFVRTRFVVPTHAPEIKRKDGTQHFRDRNIQTT